MVGSSRSLWLTVFFGLALFSGRPAVFQTTANQPEILRLLRESGRKIVADNLSPRPSAPAFTGAR
jgi:hypothetical protein